MISIDDAFVVSAAPNADAISNGRGLVVKGKFGVLNMDDSETLIFGQCQGSGKDPYRCSCDVARADLPICRLIAARARADSSPASTASGCCLPSSRSEIRSSRNTSTPASG